MADNDKRYGADNSCLSTKQTQKWIEFSLECILLTLSIITSLCIYYIGDDPQWLQSQIDA